VEEYRRPLARAETGDRAPPNAPARYQAYEESLPLFEALIKKVPSIKEEHRKQQVKRQVEFRHAETLYKLAQADEKFVDKEKVPYRSKYRDAALAALAKYHKDKEDAGGWQISLALQMLAQMQGDLGDLEASGRPTRRWRRCPACRPS